MAHYPHAWRRHRQPSGRSVRFPLRPKGQSRRRRVIRSENSVSLRPPMEQIRVRQIHLLRTKDAARKLSSCLIDRKTNNLGTLGLLWKSCRVTRRNFNSEMRYSKKASWQKYCSDLNTVSESGRLIKMQ